MKRKSNYQPTADLSRVPKASSERFTSAAAPIKARVFAEITARAPRTPTESAWSSYQHALDVVLANVVLHRGRPMLWTMNRADPPRYIEVKYDACQTVLRTMERLRMLRVVRQGSNGPNAAMCNEVHPGRGLREAMRDCEKRDLQPSRFSEIVLLKDGTKEGNLIDYTDTPLTDVNRALLDMLAKFLAGKVELPGMDGREQFRRSFTVDFDKNGRLGGHWAMSTPKTRRAEMRIDGEPVVQVDYQASVARLLFAKYGQVAPEGDLFAFPELDRDAVKTVFYALLHRRKVRNAFPSDTRDLFSREWPFPRVRDTLFQRFPMLEREMSQNTGLELFKKESDVLMTAMLMQYADGIPGVPMHDALLVPASRTGKTQYNMVRAFRAVTRVDLPASCFPMARAYSREGHDLARPLYGPIKPWEATGVTSSTLEALEGLVEVEV